MFKPIFGFFLTTRRSRQKNVGTAKIISRCQRIPFIGRFVVQPAGPTGGLLLRVVFRAPRRTAWAGVVAPEVLHRPRIGGRRGHPTG